MSRIHFFPFVAALCVGVTSCSSSTEPRPPKITISQVNVTPTATSLSIGQSAQLSALAFDQNGNIVNGSPTWATSNSFIAAVSPSGMVSAVGLGTALITAIVSGIQGVAAVSVLPNSLDITVDNQLIYAVNVTSGGAFLGTVSGQSTQRLTASSLPASASVDWELVRPIVGNRPIGDPMAGTFASASGTAGTRRLTINNLIGGTFYFAPVINNLTSTDLLMAVNYQLISENRCNCVVAAGRSLIAIGYYKLFSNSNVTAFRGTSNYTGAYTYFYDFGINIPTGSGRREFTYTSAP